MRYAPLTLTTLASLVPPEIPSTVSIVDEGVDEIDPDRIYADLAPLDPAGVLRHEWVNARGAIARFDRSAIEIRLVDVQECPRMDVAVMAALAALVRRLVERADTRQRAWAAPRLASLLARTVHHAEAAVLPDLDYLAALGVPSPRPLSAGEVWARLVEDLLSDALHLTGPRPRVLFRPGASAR